MAMTLTGFVFDSSGNPVSGATVQGYVSADNATTTAEASTTTNANGKWSISTSTAARIPMDVKITFGDSVRWLKAGDSINVSKLTLTDTLTVGEDDEGFDVIFYGETASANMTWDASADDLILNGAARIVVPDGQLVLGSTAVSSTAAELNILDGVTATASELNLLDGDTSVGGSITIADTDGFVVNDGGTMKTIPASDITTYVGAGDITSVTAGVGLSGGGSSGDVTLTLDLSELSGVTPANGDSLATLDSDGSTEQLTTIANLATLFAGTGLTASSSVLSVDASQAITALTGGDLTIYEDANNADVSLKMGTSATESLTIQVLNGSSNKTAEEVHFSTATASGTANHGKMVFDIDGTDILTIDDGGIDIASGKTVAINGTDIVSATGAITGITSLLAEDIVIGEDAQTKIDFETANEIHFDADNSQIVNITSSGVQVTGAVSSSGTGDHQGLVIAPANSAADDALGNQKGIGVIATMRAKTGVAIGELVHIDADGDLDQAHADAEADMPAVGIALEANSSGSDANIKVLLQGFYRDDSQFSFSTVGGAVFADHGTEGNFTQSASSTDGHFIQKVGIAATDDMIYFSPSLDVIEHA
mgnify:FL=1